MIGEMLTGLAVDETVEVELEKDTGAVKTKFVIRNCPEWVDYEIMRLTSIKKDAYHSAEWNLAWVSMCLLKARNWEKEGDEFEFPLTESFKSRLGTSERRIPMEWLLKKFGKRLVLLNELADACFTYNRLTPAQRKNWTWPLKSTLPEETKSSDVSGPKTQPETGSQTQAPATSASGDSQQTDGIPTAETKPAKEPPLSQPTEQSGVLGQ